MKRFFVVIYVFLYSINDFYAQTLDLGSWNIINLKYNIDDKLSVFGEGQLRSLQFYNDFHYYEYKGGINYKF
jgi:hypothetical protein